MSDAPPPAAAGAAPSSLMDPPPVALPATAGVAEGKKPQAPETVAIRELFNSPPSADADGVWNKEELDQWIATSDRQLVSSILSAGD